MISIEDIIAKHGSSLPLYFITKEQYPEWRLTMSPEVIIWLDSIGFYGSPNELALLPNVSGNLCGAVIGINGYDNKLGSCFPLTDSHLKLPRSLWHLVGDSTNKQIEDMTLNWIFSAYSYDRYLPEREVVPRLKLDPSIDFPKILAIAESEFLARDLINTPSNDFGPAELQKVVCDLDHEFGSETTVIKGKELISSNFPLIHAVGRAGSVAPRLIDLRWGTEGPRITIVGKGVCFDTGGLNIKSGPKMVLMKKDMAGAANGVAFVRAVMKMNLKVRIRLLIPAVENSISSNSIRPGDVLISRNELSVEINNTDAEGRLVLADALSYGCEENPDLIISMATLTGAARTALGPEITPFYTDDEVLSEIILKSSFICNDPLWRLPLWTPYEACIKSDIADLDNAPSGGMAGSILAALFLRRFVVNVPYLHFDLYGRQINFAPGRPKGGVGQCWRALLDGLTVFFKL